MVSWNGGVGAVGMLLLWWSLNGGVGGLLKCSWNGALGNLLIIIA